MRQLISTFALLAVLAPLPVLAQSAPTSADIKSIASSKAVADLVANAKATIKPGQPIVVQPLTALAPFRSTVEYRVGPGATMVHEKDAELFYVVEGAATLMQGGKLVGEKRLNPENVSGTSAEGGISYAIAKGDILVIPPNTPHSFNITASPLIVVSVHFTVK